MNSQLTGKTALVCGGSQGIGAAIAQALAKQGATILVVARNENRLHALVHSLPVPAHQKHALMAIDVNQRKQLQQQLSAYIDASGPLEILINNSGGPAPGSIVEATEEEFVNGFAQHVLVNRALVETLLPGMKQKQYGRIINITSTSVKIPIPNLGVSNTIRWAVAAW